MGKMKSGKLKIHGWWFESLSASVYVYEVEKKFILIHEAQT